MNNVVDLNKYHKFESGSPVLSGTPNKIPLSTTQFTDYKKPKLLKRLMKALQVRHYSIRTIKTYCHWVKRYVYFHKMRHPEEMGEEEINLFLDHLATRRKLSASSQSQALSALLFMYRNVLERELDNIEIIARARRPRHLPVVMTKEEVKAILEQLPPGMWLIASLLYSSGVRLMEGLNLRVHDIDFSYNEIQVRDGKGFKDRRTMLSEKLKIPLKRHLKIVKKIHQEDIPENFGNVYMPYALEKKYPNAPREWSWQFVFPQPARWIDPKTGVQGRHHVHPTSVQKAVRTAAKRAGIVKHATCHTFRHSFATHLMENGYDIRTVQELLGQKSVKTTMIYTHVLKKGGRGVKSPFDEF